MILLYLAVAYMVGVAAGRLAWGWGWFDCSWPTWLWILPLALLPWLPSLSSFPGMQPRGHSGLWPRQAGFLPPPRGRKFVLGLAIGLACLAGALRYVSQPLEPCWTPTDLAYYNLPADQAFARGAPHTTLRGSISSYPLVADTKQRVQVTINHLELADGEQVVTGELLLNTDIRQRYVYGQPVRLVGRLVTPPDFEDFSYREYLSRKGIHSLLYSAQIEPLTLPNAGHPLTRVLYTLRAHGEALINQLLPEPYAALANGMLLGIEAGIPDALYEQFNLTGTSHTIVISGSNVAIIAGMFMLLGQRLLGRRRAIWPTLLGIGCYALLVGGDAAVLRASLMGGLYVIATTLARRSTALVSLAVACWVMTLLNPLTLWDVGFQLSSAATAGLILFATRITTYFTKLWPGFQGGPLTDLLEAGPARKTIGLVQGLIQDGLLLTLAANITTLPLVVYYFGRLSLVSLLTNLLISPVQGFIMIWGTIGLVVGLLGLAWLAWVILLVPWLCLVWTVAMVQWTAALPGASLEISGYDFTALLLTYTLIAAVSWRSPLHDWVGRARQWLGEQWQQHAWSTGSVGALGVGCLLIWFGLASQPDGRLHLYFLNIGQGDGILIQTPSGRQILIDGGDSPQQLFSELGATMPFWDRSLDLVVVTHPDADHIAAQAELPSRFQITTALETNASQGNPNADRWRAALLAAGTAIQVQQQGGWIDLGDGVGLWVLWPPGEPFGQTQVGSEQFFENENSLVLQLVYGEFRALLTGDIGLPVEAELLTAELPLASTILKVGHHGSKGSTGEAFVEAVNPQLAIIQAGVDNDYGHPHTEVLDRLAGRQILRNDHHGRIHITSDGMTIGIETERTP